MEYSPEDTIFVQIASYRDPELQWTLKDLFEKAKRPENISVGICHQYDMKGDEDKHLFEVPFPKLNSLRIDNIDYRESQGCCWARNRVQKLWKGEKWTLMIDSHTRFEEDWDKKCIDIIKKIQKYDKNAILNKICSSYYQDNSKSNNLIKPNLYFDENDIIPYGEIKYYNSQQNKEFLSCFYSGQFTFGLSTSLLKIIYDKFLYFYGEEVNLSVRLWTNGLNLYNPNINLLWHLYKVNITDKSKYKHLNMPIICSNFNSSVDKNKKDALSFARVKHLLSTKKSNNSKVLEHINNYGLGNKRTLKDYERFSGIDFRKKTIREHTKQGVFEEWKEVNKIKDIKNLFNKLYIKL